MKILVTGAAGFIGSWLADVLSTKHEVMGIDNMIGGDMANVGDGWHLIVEDCLNLEALTEAAQGCHAVYHCAALPHEGLSVFSPALVVKNVIVASVNVMVAAIRNGCKRVVNCSSMARYGNVATPYREDGPTEPADPYGMAKREAERQLNLLGQIHGVNVIHAVPHNVIGPRQKYDDPFRNVASIMINRALQGKQPIVYGDGKQRRCFSDIQDVLPTLATLIECPLEHGEIFNVGPDEGAVTVLELARLICRLVGISSEVVFSPARPCEVSEAVCSSGKIRCLFGFVQRVSLETSLKRMIEDIGKRGPKEFKYHLPLEIDSPLTPATWKERTL